ncbi:zinc finger protein [Crotalus adamanteus]|uniref:Zinc finger protein n=1 Tax=Crotalus adamanteus TaxID=8729 RepID=A0AAW1CCT4_CROAD
MASVSPIAQARSRGPFFTRRALFSRHLERTHAESFRTLAPGAHARSARGDQARKGRKKERGARGLGGLLCRRCLCMMYRPGCGRSNMISSSRPKDSSSSGSRCSRSGASTTPTTGSARGRSPRRSRSPSPRGRRHRSPSSGRSSRRSPSPRRSSRRHSPGQCSRSPGRRSRSPGRHSRSPGRHSRSPGRHSRSPGRRSRSQHSESSVEQNLRITVGNDRYGIDTPERKRLCDRLGSPVDSLSDVDRDDLADGPIFSRSLLHRRSLERYPSQPQYLYRPDEAPAMPKKSILKKRVDDHSVQPEVFSCSSSSIKEPPLLSNPSSLPQRSSVAPFSLEVENFLKQFNKSAVAESTIASYSKVHPQFSQPSLRGSKERISDEKNRASRKQKVIEEIEKLKAEQEARQKKLHYLRAELNRLSKQQGELLRKKRREKDGHKDPLLIEVNRLQDNIVKEITQLKMNADAAEKKQSELDKVAQILGINIFEKSRKLSSESKDSSENARIQEKTSDLVKESKTNSDRFRGKSPKPMESSSQPLQRTSIYDYYDTGNHWCKDCNTTCGTMFDFFTHMHNKKHRQTLDPYNRPWAAKTQIETKQEVTKRIDKIPVPAKGSEFLIPVTGYYCQLCSEFFGDQISAEQHVKSHLHNEKYKKHVDENPLYEERRNLDHQAGLSVIQETERRLRRKLCEKQKEEKDEKTTKIAKKEETKNIKELGDGNNEYEISKKKEIPNGEKCGIKLKLKKDDKEIEKKEDRKEESEKESKLTTFGKFSWRKSERDEKNQGKDVAVSKEESPEESKDKESALLYCRYLQDHHCHYLYHSHHP